MRKVSLNQDWQLFRHGDGASFHVDIPNDALLLGKRTREGTSKKGYYQNDSFTYTKTFRVEPKDKETKIYLEFEGVYTRATIYINGEKVGYHAYGYTPFIIDISEHVKLEEENLLQVDCSSGDDSRWYSGAGIYRDVNLYYGEEKHFPLSGVQITTLEASKDQAKIRLQSKGPKDCLTAYAVYYGKALVATAQGEDTIIEINRPCLWNDAHPYLYRLEAYLIQDGRIVDTYITSFGIRQIELVPGKGLFVNGELTKLCGTCIHHDNGILGAASYPCVEKRKIAKLKEAGFNAIRIAHHPAGKAVLDACDCLGMYVINEAFDAWHQCKSKEDYALDFDEHWEEDITAMVESSFNHPCVLFYSLGNEIPDLAFSKGIKTLKMLNAKVKALDDSRFTLTAVNGLMEITQRRQARNEIGEPWQDINLIMSKVRDEFKSIHQSQEVDDILTEISTCVDIVGYNYMNERYALDAKLHPDRLIIGTETYPQESDDVYAYMESHSNVIGDFLWTGLDYLGEAGLGSIDYEHAPSNCWVYGEYPYLTADCGDIDIILRRLPASYRHQIALKQRKEPYIAVYSPKATSQTPYPSLWAYDDVRHCYEYPGEEGKDIRVDVYSSNEEVSLYLNDKLLGTKPTKKNVASFVFPYVPGTLQAIDKEGNVSTLATPGPEVGIRMDIERDELTFVHLTLCDRQGNVHFNHDQRLHLDIVGGKLLGFGNGNPKDEEGFLSSIHFTYQGEALAIIAPEKGKDLVLTIKPVGESI